VGVETATAAGVDACLVAFGFGYPAVGPAHRAQARWTIDAIDALIARAPVARY